MKTDQTAKLSPQQIGEKPFNKKASFSLVMSTVAIVLGMLFVAAVYYYNTNTHITP